MAKGERNLTDAGKGLELLLEEYECLLALEFLRGISIHNYSGDSVVDRPPVSIRVIRALRDHKLIHPWHTDATGNLNSFLLTQLGLDVLTISRKFADSVRSKLYEIRTSSIHPSP